MIFYRERRHMKTMTVITLETRTEQGSLVSEQYHDQDQSVSGQGRRH